MAESGLSGNDVLKFGGASRENPGISEGFHGLGFTLGELDRGNTGFFTAVVTALSTEEVGDLSETAGVLDGNVGLLRIGVAVLGKDFGAGILGLLAGDEALMVDLAVGVDDLGGTIGFAEGKVGRAVGVADLEGLHVAVDVTFDVVEEGLVAVVNVRLFDAGVELDRVELRVGRPVGVDGLDPGPPPEEDGLWSPPVEVFNPEDAVSCL